MSADVDELHRLEQQIRAAVKERADIEQRLANPAALRSATARAYRDRDAVTSPLLEEARRKVSADIADLHGRWRQIDGIAHRVDRLADLLETAPTHVQEHRDAIMAALNQVRLGRSRIAQDLTTAGLECLLPEGAGADGQR
ncbi:hypothetical protein [Mycobacterium kansasii]|uniref:hypothetical protein n=1 Tax=Mycobacterium kansasii TaxID=1768 RepID=UPI001CE38704|nr:hypothetical protein [Mycobacterium kansasii]UCA22858.1 hypothetical protein LA359_28435 [Mycobacterium kansasii]